MTTITGRAPAGAADVSLQPITLLWALKRALVGIAILVVTMGGVAWLTYASIDPDPDRGDQPKAVKALHAPLAQVRL